MVHVNRFEVGALVKNVLIAERQPTANEFYTDADRPDGEWTVGAHAVNRFAKDQVTTCFLSWTAKGENRVGLAVASARRTLASGERLTLDADYGGR